VHGAISFFLWVRVETDFACLFGKVEKGVAVFRELAITGAGEVLPPFSCP